ncbi:hypothetical protein CR513_25922, partial [Mucuna pruriens]
MNKSTIILTSLKPIEAYVNQIRIAREYKLREDQLSIQEKERKDNKKKMKEMSAFAEKKEVEKEVSHALPYLRGIEHQIDLIPSSPILNRPAYRTNPKETKEIQKQVNELLQKGFVRESLSPCYVPVILVSKKDGT